MLEVVILSRHILTGRTVALIKGALATRLLMAIFLVLVLDHCSLRPKG